MDDDYRDDLKEPMLHRTVLKLSIKDARAAYFLLFMGSFLGFHYWYLGNAKKSLLHIFIYLVIMLTLIGKFEVDTSNLFMLFFAIVWLAYIIVKWKTIKPLVEEYNNKLRSKNG